MKMYYVGMERDEKSRNGRVKIVNGTIPSVWNQGNSATNKCIRMAMAQSVVFPFLTFVLSVNPLTYLIPVII